MDFDAIALLKELRAKADRRTMTVLPISQSHYYSAECRKLIPWTCLTAPLEGMKLNPAACARLVTKLAGTSPGFNRALGCMVGLAIGDSVGAPLEFIPVDSSPPPFRLKKTRTDQGRLAFLDPTLSPKGELVYAEEYNKFNLNRGQWTDDCSMSLALAESMIAHGRYEGGDVRVRYYLWWYFGYCNAFRFDTDTTRTSVGLGGNISKSIDDVSRFNGADWKGVPPQFAAQGEDAGNGSMMRLAPVPIRYHRDVGVSLSVADLSSLATHPGTDAGVCCKFMSYFILEAFNRKSQNITAAAFLDAVIAHFSSEVTEKEGTAAKTSLEKLFQLLKSQPPSPKEACWNWKADRIDLEGTIANRGKTYNGYPVSPGYFGSYCMDGLAMALWGFSHSNSFSDCVLKVVNLLGDCDTTGAIAGQLAGAFYGYESIVKDPIGSVFLKNLRQWDPCSEIELRGAILFLDGEEDLPCPDVE